MSEGKVFWIHPEKEFINWINNANIFYNTLVDRIVPGYPKEKAKELEKELGELKSELFKLRFSLATNGLDNPMKIKEVRKDIAKINTVLTERKLAEENK